MRFTALDVPAIMKTIHSTKSTGPIEGPKSRRNEKWASAGVMSYPSGNRAAPRSANTAPTTAWPASLAPLRRPRLRCL